MSDNKDALERDIELEGSDAEDVKAGAGISANTHDGSASASGGGTSAGASTGGSQAGAGASGHGLNVGADANKPRVNKPKLNKGPRGPR